MLRVFEKHAKRLRQLVVFLNQRLVIHFFEKRSLFLILCRSGDKVGVGFDIKPLLVCQHSIPNITAAAEGFLKKRRLLRRRIKAGLNRVVLYRFSLCKGLTFAFSRRHFTPFPLCFRKVHFFRAKKISEKMPEKGLTFLVCLPNSYV